MAFLLQSRADENIDNTDMLQNSSRRKRQIPKGRQGSPCSLSPGGGGDGGKKQCQKKKKATSEKKQNHITGPPLSNLWLCGFGHLGGNSEDWVWYIVVLLVGYLRRAA